MTKEIKIPDNLLEIVNKFREQYQRSFWNKIDDSAFLEIYEHFLKETDVTNKHKDHICTDELCYCNRYKLGDLMKDCDGGCMYPGA